MARAVRFSEYGEPEVLRVEEIDVPPPGEGQVAVAVKAAGINPGESPIRRGVMAPKPLPSGQGSDFAGVVTALGEGVGNVSVGDEVLGWSWDRSSQASEVVVAANQVVHKPAGLAWEVAGSLYVVGCTAYAAARAVAAGSGDTVVVSAAAGGVGSVLVQLLVSRGCTVLGIASEANHAWLSEKGVVPFAYGDGLQAALAAHQPDAFIDLFGPDYLDLAVALEIPLDRINTIISFERAAKLGITAEGSGAATSPEVLAEMAHLVADGTIEVPVAATYPLEQVVAAVTELEKRHTRGKIVLIP